MQFEFLSSEEIMNDINNISMFMNYNVGVILYFHGKKQCCFNKLATDLHVSLSIFYFHIFSYLYFHILNINPKRGG